MKGKESIFDLSVWKFLVMIGYMLDLEKWFLYKKCKEFM